MTKKIVLVDEHPLLASALRSLLERQFPGTEIQVVGTLGDACRAHSEAPADLVFADMLCSSGDDYEAMTDVISAVAPARVIVFGKCGRTNLKRLMSSGIHGYVLASSPPDLIAAAAALVAAGGIYAPPAAQGTRPEDQRGFVDQLSSRQRQVLQGLIAGKSNKAIAQALGISLATAKMHVQSILRQSGARNRTEAVALANRELSGD